MPWYALVNWLYMANLTDSALGIDRYSHIYTAAEQQAAVRGLISDANKERKRS
jgi:hypothetical protein